MSSTDIKCGSMSIDTDWRPVVTEDPDLVYIPNGVSWQYVPDAPATIIDEGKRVKFWTTPVFHRMWYTPCNMNADAARQRCEQSTKSDPLFKDSKYMTGLVGKEQSTSAGLKCYGAGCVAEASYVCGGLLAPKIGLAPGRVSDVKYEGGKVVAVEYTFVSTLVTNVDDFRKIYALTYDGQDLSKFIPKNIGVFLLSRYCMYKENQGPRKGDYYMFTRKECADIKYLSTEAYNDILSSICVGKNLHERQCRLYCSDKNINCDDRIEGYCKSLGPAVALDKNHSDVCGCFMGNQFYEKYFTDLKKKFNFPVTAPPSQVCYFGYCASSNVKPYNYRQNPTKCPDVMNCFQNTNVVITAGGNIEIGDVTVSPTLECQNLVQRKCVSNGDCESGFKCVGGVCRREGQPPQSGCSSDAQCPPNMRCVNNKCTDNRCSVFCYGKCVEGKCVYEPVTDNALVGFAALAALGTVALAIL